MHKSLLAATLAATLGISTAGACGLHGTIDNPFTTSYPGSLGVALGTQQAVVNGQLSALPEVDAEAAHERLEETLDQLRARLEKASLKGGFALFVVESGHWARFEAKGHAVRIAAHAAPSSDEPVLLTSEAALTALLDGRLATGAALQAGLVRWAGNASPALAQALQMALASST
jgi:glutamate-1-semialdehyde aminotransferase